MSDTPDFMKPPAEANSNPNPSTNVLPFRNKRMLNDDLVLARDKAFRELSIDSQRLLHQVVQIGEMLIAGTETVRDHLGDQMEIPLSRERITALNSAKDICFKLLAKTVPDIKQIQVTDEKGNEVPFTFEMFIGDD